MEHNISSLFKGLINWGQKQCIVLNLVEVTVDFQNCALSETVRPLNRSNRGCFVSDIEQLCLQNPTDFVLFLFTQVSRLLHINKSLI